MPDQLLGLRVCIIEDEYILADTLEDELRRRGADVPLILPDLKSARANMASIASCDAVVMDLKLRDGSAIDLGAELIGLGLYTIFTSAYSQYVLDTRHAGAPFFAKPFNFYDIVLALSQSTQMA